MFGVKTVLSAIDRILSSTGTQEIGECEPALEALGQIRSCKDVVNNWNVLVR
ncbi:hypothetical protein D8674_005088 [Pyrus ussuriensis x Pyrus communis]|uniref:Uncharacterized protein n=1 Tax=Pyrus ussuriensis x Pyrus communis TaxID=2448454 RepID=A0A5N5FUU9_9ROSA|nr:hypothetical protein D8674_005088 [Pyrus ussuriensis x Pyrus communis]